MMQNIDTVEEIKTGGSSISDINEYSRRPASCPTNTRNNAMVPACQLKNDNWDLIKLNQVIQMLNADQEMRRLTAIFRQERREIFGNMQVDPTTFNNCCQVLLDEIDDQIEIKLGANGIKKYK